MLAEFERYCKICLLWMLPSNSAQLRWSSLHLQPLQVSPAVPRHHASSFPCLQLFHRCSLVMRTWATPEATSWDNRWAAICTFPTNEVGKARVRRQLSLRNVRCSVLGTMKKADWKPHHSCLAAQERLVSASTLQPDNLRRGFHQHL